MFVTLRQAQGERQIYFANTSQGTRRGCKGLSPQQLTQHDPLLHIKHHF
jgi:hypothetical protein